MSKTIVITGSTDGIGLLTARILAAEGHKLCLHGRDRRKLDAALDELRDQTPKHQAQGYIAELSRFDGVEKLAQDILRDHDRIDVLINNAGVLKTPNTRSPEGLDVRFMVNTIAPYLLTRRLLARIPREGRIVNLSSAAQAAVDIEALAGRRPLEDMTAYAQSKLAITIWSRELAKELTDGPVVVAVNPGSLLASKMVKEGFGVAGNDLQIGADILREAALGASFATASGAYYDNDQKAFTTPNPAALNDDHSRQVMRKINEIVTDA